MCGRFSQTAAEKNTLLKRFRVKTTPTKLKPRYNIAPSQGVDVILNTSPDEITSVRWGLIPFWAKDEKIAYKMINARAETIFEKPSFRMPIKKQRCLIIADGFYEWQRTEDGKQPYRICLKDESLFAFAGIWDAWKRGEEEVLSCSIITIAANALVAKVHDRMPVILPPDQEALWLSDASPDEIKSLLKPYPASRMKAYPISTAVNAPSNNAPEIWTEIK